jgi:hypothetical protein
MEINKKEYFNYSLEWFITISIISIEKPPFLFPPRGK